MTPSWRRLEAIKATTQNLRRLQGNADDSACDAQFLACLKSTDCVDCFIELETKVSRACEQKEKERFWWSFPLPAFSLSNARAKLLNQEIDWASVTPDTPCSDVTQFLFKANHCKSMENDATGKEAFCNAYDVCVEWTDPSEDKKKDKQEGEEEDKKNSKPSIESDSDLDSDVEDDDSDDEFVQRDEDAKVHTSRLARQGGVG